VIGIALALAAVVALLLWPPSAGGATVTCGQAITQDTRVDNDLSCPFQALSIGADNITLDLNGRRIAGAPAILSGREGATIENGVVEATGLILTPGIQLDRAHGVTIRDSVFYGHGPALRLLGPDDNRALDNVFVKNGFGLLRSEADRNRVVANLLQDNGFAINAAGSRNHIRANDTRQNEIGIIAGCGLGTVVRANLARRNRANGIQVEACASLGIQAVPGVTDAGGNRARGNGNPAQCQNVACSP
jgi:Right handed beta helix region